MEPRDAFQNIYYRQFWWLINKVLRPNSGNKIFSKYYHYCHFVYIKCAIIMPLYTELYHYKKIRKKIEWVPRSIHTRFWTQSEIKGHILGPIEVFSKYWKLWLAFVLSIIAQNLNYIANNIASSNLLLVTVYTHKIKLVKRWILQSWITFFLLTIDKISFFWLLQD